MKIGSVEATPGKVAKGYINLVSFPTGGEEKAPIMVARGHSDGPTLWLTANLHGNEVTGVPVVHRIVTEEIAQRIRGTVVGVVSLNPSGLRNVKRNSDYDSRDPNRLFPDFMGKSSTPSYTQEIINRKIFDEISESADMLIDLHCSNVGSVPFTILDRIFANESDLDRAKEIEREVREMANAFGFTPINGETKERTLEKDLHRSLTGSLINKARIPCFTAELGSDYIIQNEMVDAAVTGVKNVMRVKGMLDGKTEEVTGIPKLSREFPVKRRTIESPVSGLLKKHVEPGELVREGDPVYEVTNAFGETKHVAEAREDGWVTSFELGIGIEEGSHVCYYAGRDDNNELVETI